MASDEIIEKIRKVAAQAKRTVGNDGASNEAEAQAFATLLQKMLAKHNLEMSDIQWEEEIHQKAVEVSWHTPDMKRFSEWVVNLGTIIAKANYCKCLTGGNYYIYFIGTEAAAKVSSETMDYMYKVAEHISTDEYNKRYNEMYAEGRHGLLKGYRRSFLLGFVIRLNDRFEEIRRQMAKDFKSTALVRMNQSLALAEEYLKEKKVKMRVDKRKPETVNRIGMRDGVAKANTLNIGGPVLPEGE
jgi:Protein of unknown function (DUF2786)